jgi:hypothetical protein
MTRLEPQDRIRHLRARAAHARELGAVFIGDERVTRNLDRFAADLEREASELEARIQAEAAPRPPPATPASLPDKIVAMRAELPESPGDDLALLYRDRAKRLRALAEAMQDLAQIQLLKTIADDYEQLADKLSQ